MGLWIWIAILLVGIIIAQALTKKPGIISYKSEESSETDGKQIRYGKKSFLTASEKSFLAILNELAKYELIIVPQVNLATVVRKMGEFRYQNELYRNIDFGVFDREYNLLLLIELNDSSHQRSNRRERDMKVREIIKQAELKLMTFYTDKPNKSEYVIDRILGEIGVLKEEDH